MIGAHDTMTYLKSTSFLFNNTKKYWKTQAFSIDQLYKWGVRMFDIRVIRGIGRWRAAHGSVALKYTWKHLEDICKMFVKKYPKAIYRIVLDRGTKYAQKKFIKEGKNLSKKYTQCWRVDIRSRKDWMGSVDNNNELLKLMGYKFADKATWQAPAYEVHGKLDNISDIFDKVDLRKQALNINNGLPFWSYMFGDKGKDTEITKAEKQAAWIKQALSKDTLFLIDFCLPDNIDPDSIDPELAEKLK